MIFTSEFQVNYCSVDCQKLHWFAHKKWCAQMKKEHEEREEQKRQNIELEER